MKRAAAAALIGMAAAGASAKTLDLVCTDTDKGPRKLYQPIHIRIDDTEHQVWINGSAAAPSQEFQLRVDDVQISLKFSYDDGRTGEKIMSNIVTINRFTGFADWTQIGPNHFSATEYRCELKAAKKF